MIFGRADLRKGVSGAKFDAKSDFEVHFAVVPQKLHKNCEKLIFQAKLLLTIFLGCQKLKCWESSETRFPKVSHRSELCLRGKQPFKVFNFFSKIITLA